MIEQYKRDMKPMHDKFVESLKEYADVIIDGNIEQNPVYNNVLKHLSKLHIIDEDLER